MLFLLLALIAQPGLDSSAEPRSATEDIVYYGGRRVTFFARSEEVVLLDSAWVRYRDMSVRCDSIHYDIRSRTLSAFGKVDFRTSTEQIDGELLRYNVDGRRGMMRSAHTQVENGFFAAQEVWLVKEKVINARRGSYTTCDLPHPHYSFYGPRVKLLMDDIVIAQPVVLRIGSVPVLAAPFWFVPAASKRKSGLMAFKTGYSNDLGYYAQNIAYYWVLNDYSDLTATLDIMTRRGVQFRGEGVYIVSPFARGSIQGAYINESWNNQSRKLRYTLNTAHSALLTPNTELAINAELLSDTGYVPEYAEDRLDWLKQEVSSYASLSHRFRSIGRATGRVEQRKYFIRHYEYWHLPGVSMNFNTRTLPGGWDITPSITVTRTFDRADSFGIDTASSIRLTPSGYVGLESPDLGITRFSLTEALGYSDSRYRSHLTNNRNVRSWRNNMTAQSTQRFFSAFNTSQTLSLTQTDVLEDTSPVEPVYSASFGLSFPMYKVFGLETFGLHGLLHTAIPAFSLRYEPAILSGGLFGRPRLDSVRSASLSASLENGFQVKAGPDKRKLDIGRVGLTTSYDLKTGRLTPVNADLGITPLLPFRAADTGRIRRGLDIRVDAAGSFDASELRPSDDYSVRTSLTWQWTVRDSAPGSERGIKLSASHALGRNQHMLLGTVSIALPGWNLSLNSLGYNFALKQLTDYSLSITRDLHCWEALVNLSSLGATWRYDFEVRIKKLPDVKFGKSTFRTFLPGIQ